MTIREAAARLSRPLRKSAGLDASGQATVEVAITLVSFLVLVFGIIGGGRMIWDYTVVSNAAGEAVRWAAVRGSQNSSPADATAITTFAKSMAAGLDPDGITVTPSWPTNNKPGSLVQVTVAYTFEFPFFPAIPLSSTAQMTIAR